MIVAIAYQGREMASDDRPGKMFEVSAATPRGEFGAIIGVAEDFDKSAIEFLGPIGLN